MARVSTVVLFGLAVEREERQEGGYLYNITQVANSLGFRASNAVRRFKQDKDYFMKAPAPHKARPSFWGTWDVLWQCLVGMKTFTKRSRQIYEDISRFVEDNALLLETSRGPTIPSVMEEPPLGMARGHGEQTLMGSAPMEERDSRVDMRQLQNENFVENFNRADRLEKSGDLFNAVVAYDRCLAVEPTHSVALNNRGHLLYRLVEFKRALMDYDRAIAADPMLTVARYNRGEVLYRLMRYSEAEKDLEDVLQQKSDFEEARRLLEVCRAEHADKTAKSAATASCAEVDEEIAASVSLEPNVDLSFADRVAYACLHQYYRLSSKGKPKEREWGVLAGIAMTLPSLHDPNSLEVKVVALATGTKCLSMNKMREEGDVVHDCHAEALVHRLFQHFIEQEILNAGQSRVLELSNDLSGVHSSRYRLKEMVSFHLYISQTPCGDASIFPVREIAVSYDTAVGQKRVRADNNGMADFGSQRRAEEASESPLASGADHMASKRLRQLSDGPLALSGTSRQPNEHQQIPLQVAESNNVGVMAAVDLHRTGAKVVPSSPLQDPKGEGINYHVTGVLRTKPGQVENTLCLSCSDKIAMWTVVGAQGALLSMLLSKPLYFSSVIVGSLYSEDSLRRALVTRIAGIQVDQQRSPGYQATPPNIYHTHLQYSRSKEVLDVRVGDWVRLNPAGAAMVWSCADVHEVIVGNGKLQGVTKKTFENPKLNSILCNRSKFARFAHILASVPPFAAAHIPQLGEGTTFSEVKQYAVEFQAAKHQLFSQVPAFSHWIRTSPQWSRFTLDGSVVPLVDGMGGQPRQGHEQDQERGQAQHQRQSQSQERQEQRPDSVMEIDSGAQLELQELPEFPDLPSA